MKPHVVLGLLLIILALTAQVLLAGSICGDGHVDPGETCDPPGPPTCDCCQAHPETGCNDATCELSVCSIDPFCCLSGWDSICVGEAWALPQCVSCCADCRSDCTFCGDGLLNGTEECDPPGPQSGCDCCAATGVPGCNDAACQAAVCSADPFCCDTEWDLICSIQAQDHLPCLSCCPRAQCSEQCRMDEDGDGLADADDPCPSAPNPAGGSALFGQAVFALETKDTFAWSHETDFVFVRGSFLNAFEIGGYVEEMTSSGSGEYSVDLMMPDTRAGYWYLWKPDCSDASWTCGEPAEIECLAPSDCCVAHDTPGCSDGACASAVCQNEPSCCQEIWNGSCADEALALSACVNGCDGNLCRDAALP